MSGMFGRTKYDNSKKSREDRLSTQIGEYSLFSGTRINSTFKSNGDRICTSKGKCITMSNSNQSLGTESLGSRVDLENSLKSGKYMSKSNTQRQSPVIASNPYVYERDIVAGNLRA